MLYWASIAFNDYGPLLQLKRFREASELLFNCREVFEDEEFQEGLGKVFSALANLEDVLGRSMTAVDFEQTALRYKYAQGNPGDVQISHFNIANYIIHLYGVSSEALAHRLAAVLIAVVMRSGQAAPSLAALAQDLRSAGPQGRTAVPADFTALRATVEKVEGVRFREMIERLAGGAAECEELFRQVVAKVLEATNKPE